MIGVIGDLHFKDSLSYADYIQDRRFAEKEAVLDTIVKAFKDCKYVVFMGDNFNSKNNSAETVREFVAFLERFNDKEVYIISGNHEKRGDGKTAIDFLGEANKPNWHVYTKPGFTEFVWGEGEDQQSMEVKFLPYMLKSEMGVETDKEVVDKLLKEHLGNGTDVLFAHHAISDTFAGFIPVNSFKEPILPKEELEKRYKLVVAGHIHNWSHTGRTLITGSVFTDQVGETSKQVYILDKDLRVKEVELPVRPIFHMVNPSPAKLPTMVYTFPHKPIVKIEITDKTIDVEKIKEMANMVFDAHIIVLNYPNERQRIDVKEGAFDFGLDNLLKIYADVKKVDLDSLKKGFDLIK